MLCFESIAKARCESYSRVRGRLTQRARVGHRQAAGAVVIAKGIEVRERQQPRAHLLVRFLDSIVESAIMSVREPVSHGNAGTY